VCACSTAACLCSASPTCGSCRFPINQCVRFVYVNICDIVIAACVLVLLLPVCAANLLYEGPFRFPVDRVWFLCIFAHISNRDMGVCVCSTTPYLCSASTTHGSMSRPTCVFCACLHTYKIGVYVRVYMLLLLIICTAYVLHAGPSRFLVDLRVVRVYVRTYIR